MSRPIAFHFHPYGWDTKSHVVEKEENGAKRRYLSGISSGLDIDAHGERMTANAIKSFMDQANAGDVLLFPDVHGIAESEDIGILTKASIMPTGEWFTEYRLYDDADGIGVLKKEKIEGIWKQLNGFPPYTKPRQKGFSVEGIIMDDSILQNSQTRSSVIDNVRLDGVVLVPRPAYKDSIATSIYKALGETTPDREGKLRSTIRAKLQDRESEQDYYEARWQYQDALDEVVDNLMSRRGNNKKQELEIIYSEFSELMIDLILKSETIFLDDVQKSSFDSYVSGRSRVDLLKVLKSEIHRFKILKEAKK